MTTLGPPGQSPYCEVSRSAALVPPATLSALCYITYIVTGSRIKHGHPCGAVTLGTTLLLRDAGIKRGKKGHPSRQGWPHWAGQVLSGYTIEDKDALGKVR